MNTLRSNRYYKTDFESHPIGKGTHSSRLLESDIELIKFLKHKNISDLNFLDLAASTCVTSYETHKMIAVLLLPFQLILIIPDHQPGQPCSKKQQVLAHQPVLLVVCAP